jgi:hypothetical protein
MNNNILDMLLKADITKIIKPTRQLEINRLSENLGFQVVFTIEGLTASENEEIQEFAINVTKRGDVEDFDLGEVQIMTVLKGVKEPNFKDKSLCEKFGAVTPKELIQKMLLPGEVSKLYQEISDLAGYGEKAVTEIKN